MVEETEDAQRLVRAAVRARAANDFAGFDHALSRLAESPGEPGWQRAVELTLVDSLTRAVAGLWSTGWQPSDVARIVGRKLDRAHADLLRDVIAGERLGYAAALVDPRWEAQLAELGARVWWPREKSLLRALIEQGTTPRFTITERALTTLHLLKALPPVEVLLAPPGAARPAAGANVAEAPPVDGRILSRVRALLAKAESTTFEAEAETFTAGAQALMARHSIDLALLAQTDPRRATMPGGRRIGIDNPYEESKAILLGEVAAANRCRTVWNRGLGFSTVIGFEADLDSIELLFTSLLVQATTAMNREGSKTGRYGRSETKSFRRSFLIAFAHRIGQRLGEATTAETASAAAEPEYGSLLPVLAARDKAVDEATSSMFPTLARVRQSRITNADGWYSGLSAADRASLAHGAAVTD